MPSLADELFQAHQRQATGKLSIFAGGRHSFLLLESGDVVGAEIRAGYQNAVQTLLAEQVISTQDVDAWWSRGVADALDDDALSALPPTLNPEILKLASSVRALCACAEEVRLEEMAETSAGRRLPLAPILRAAFQAVPPATNDEYRLVSMEVARPWLLPGEEEWLSSFSEFALPAPESVWLLELLRRLGAVEPREMVEGRESGSLDPAAQPPQDELPREFSDDEAPLMQSARQRAQVDLLREMDEALRRAGTTSEGDWRLPGEATIELTSEMSSEEPAAQQAPGVAHIEPIIFGPGATTTARLDDDLWRLVEFDSAQTDAASSSFEAALEQIDASLEQIIGSVPAAEGEMPVEAEVQSSDAYPVDVPVDDFFGIESWPFNEDDLATDPMDPADEARARRQRLLRRAMENMGTLQPPRRPEGAEVVPPPQPTFETISPEAPPDSAQEKQFADAIEQRFAALQSDKDHFAILAVSAQATKDQVKSAFLNLAKIFHPDRLPASLQGLTPKINAVFESIREAYDALHDDAKRQDYVKRLASSRKSSPSPATNPSDGSAAFKQAELLFKRKDYALAEEQYDAAFAVDRKAVYLAGKAWCLFMDPARHGDGSKAKQILNEALRLERNCDRALYQLGVIARVEGDIERAERHFREALQVNPKHVEAKQELRLIEMRKKKGK